MRFNSFVFAWLLLAGGFAAGQSAVDYERDIKPILHERCRACHGGLKQEAELRLDTGALIRQGGAGGPVVVPGRPAESLLIQRVSSADAELRMPPEGEPLTKDQLELLRRWVAAGARSPRDELREQAPTEHWAFQLPVRPPWPATIDRSWVRNSIDAFISARHAEQGLEPSPPASKEVLLRRVYFDLTGLPPTRQDFVDFLADQSSAAYETVVERLLASPQYGERWGRHWMDVWRYSDWYGRRAANDVRNSSAQIWRWRDWIVQSLNYGKGYDRMILEMLAGDELAPDDPDVVVATGFIVRNCYRLNFDTWKQDMVEHTGKAFLGLRFNCAHCHDHKYDPISQKEYFQMRAFFEPLMLRHDRLPGLPVPAKYTIYDFHSNGQEPTVAGLARVYDGYPQAATRMYRGGDPRDLWPDASPVAPGVPTALGGQPLRVARVDLPATAFFPGAQRFVQQEEHGDAAAAVRAAQAERDKSRRELEMRSAQLEARIDQAAHELNVAHKSFDTWRGRLTRARNPRRTGLRGDGTDESPLAEGALAWWRFEAGGEDARLLADSSGNQPALLRSTGGDARVPAHRLPLTGAGRGFAHQAGDGAGGVNSECLLFDERGGDSFLYCVAGPALFAGEFTVEMLLNITASTAPDAVRTLVDYQNCWALVYRGLSRSAYELQLRLTDSSGGRQDLSSNTGQQPLLLVAQHDYYLAVTVSPEQVTVWARDLTADGKLQSVRISRGGAPLRSLAQPPERASFWIGKSPSTERHRGLLDEIRLSQGVLAETEVESHAQSSPKHAQLAAAEQRLVTARYQRRILHLTHTLHEAQLDAAVARRSALAMRIAADRANLIENSPEADTAAQAAARAERAASLAAAKAQLAAAMKQLAELELAVWTEPARTAALAQAEHDLDQARHAVAQAVQDTLEPPTANYSSITEVFPRYSTGRRSALANWIASQENPLTARVAINHIWLRHFGTPIVETVNDFGRGGKQPSLPRLLDWLAVELIEAGWQMKDIHRLIVTSNTYRMESRANERHEHNLAIDPQNRYLWRFNSRRLEAESVRDAILAAAGQLDLRQGGKDIEIDLGETSPRRSMYFTQHPEGGRLKFMSVFDPPNPCDAYRRHASVVPQQALALTNSRLMINQSRLLARALWRSIEHGPEAQNSGDDAFVQAAFAQILSRYPTGEEIEICCEFMRTQYKLYERTDAASLLMGAPAGSISPASDPWMRARESLIAAIYSHNDFVTVR